MFVRMQQLVGLLLFALWAQVGAAATFDAPFALRPSRSLSDSDIRNLETVLRAAMKGPETPRNGTLEQLLARYCGTATPERLSAIRELNPDATSAYVVLPPCIRWVRQKKIGLPHHAAPEALAKRLNAKYLGSTDKMLAAGSLIELNDVTSPSVESQIKDKALMTTLSSAFDTYAIRPFGPENPGLSVFDLISLSSPVPEDATLEESDVRQCQSPRANWPVPASDVLETLEKYQAHRTDSKPAVVVVTDTGFPVERLSQLPLFSRDGSDPPQHWGRYVSPNTDQSDSMNALSPTVDSYAYADHGLAVASVAAGLSVFGRDAVAGNRWVRIYAHSILTLSDTGKLGADAGGLAGSLVYASTDISRSKRSPIINISWAHRYENPMFKKQLDRISALVVVAAGNEAEMNLDDEASYPASYGDTPNVITVAAIGQNNELLSFSTRGPAFVSLAAPGCLVPSFDRGGDIVDSNGTSVAAPLVAFTAAVIHALGIQDPREIKLRLLLTADRSDALSEAVRGGAILNIPNAIAIGHDLVRTSDWTTRGFLTSPPYVLLPDGTPVEWSRIVRIRVFKDGGDKLRGEIQYRVPGKPLRWTDGRAFDPAQLPRLSLVDWSGATRVLDPGSEFEIVPRSRPLKF